MRSQAEASTVPRKGRFLARAVHFTTKARNVPSPAAPRSSVMHGEDDGLIFNETGGSFLDCVRYQVYWTADLVEDAWKLEGRSVFTLSDGSQIFGESQGDLASGTWAFTGGTGKYQGVRGHGTYDLTHVTDTLTMEVLDGKYELP